MPTQTGPGLGQTGTVDEQFLALLCTDVDLLRAEFDAIIAAEWPSPPATSRGCIRTQPRNAQPLGHARGHHAPRIIRRRHPRGGRTRQRSPPPRRKAVGGQHRTRHHRGHPSASRFERSLAKAAVRRFYAGRRTRRTGAPSHTHAGPGQPAILTGVQHGQPSRHDHQTIRPIRRAGSVPGRYPRRDRPRLPRAPSPIPP